MKSLKLLAEKYDVVQVQRSDEALVAAQTPGQLLEAFQELSQISEDVIVAFEHAITNRSSLIKENTAEQDSDVRVAVLAMEKVLAHLDESKDEQFCLAFEAFAKNASLKQADLAVLSEAKGGFFSKLGKGIKKYAGKAAKAVGKGFNAANKAAGNVVGGIGGALRGAGQTFTAGVKQGYSAGKAATGPGATATPATAAPTTATSATKTPATKTPTTKTPTTVATPAATTAPGAIAAAPTTAPVASQTPAPANTKSVRVGAPAARQAVDSAVKTVATMRSDRRNGVIDYAIQKLTALKKGAAGSTKSVGTPTNAAQVNTAAESLVAESVESFYITTNKHFRK